MIYGELSQNGGGDTAVPGENLLVGTRNMTGNNWLYDNRLTIGYYNRFKTIQFKNNPSDSAIAMGLFEQTLKVKHNTKYTLSYIGKGNKISTFLFSNHGGVHAIKAISNTGVETNTSDGSIVINMTPEYRRYWIHYLTSSDGDIELGTKVLIRNQFPESDTTIFAPKLEEGWVTDPIWTPSAEDARAESNAMDAYSYGYQRLSSKGWYRVGQINSTCIITLKRDYSNTNNETYCLLVLIAYRKAKIVPLGSLINAQILKKVRISFNPTELCNYLDIYYDADVGNTCYVTMLDRYGSSILIQKVLSTWEKVDETISGESLVTSLDLS